MPQILSIGEECLNTTEAVSHGVLGSLGDSEKLEERPNTTEHRNRPGKGRKKEREKNSRQPGSSLEAGRNTADRTKRTATLTGSYLENLGGGGVGPREWYGQGYNILLDNHAKRAFNKKEKDSKSKKAAGGCKKGHPDARIVRAIPTRGGEGRGETSESRWVG